MAALQPVHAALLDTVTGSSSSTNSEAELSRKFLHYLILQRDVEERIERRLYRQGKILGGVYVGRGQEAICVGSGMVAEPDDMLFPCHRDLGLYFIRGIHPRNVFAQYMGRVGGLTNGRDGNMHMGDLSKRIVAIISAMAASVPVAAGAGMAMKYLGLKSIVFNYFGDGATSRGDWHEGINLAAVQKAPVIFICNNNQYAYSTPLEKQMACHHVADRAPGYGIPAEIVDGNDVWAVYNATKRAADHCRAGNGPYLIECKTFRMTGHSAHDGGDYVPKHMWDEWGAKDPIARLERRMIDRGEATRAEIEGIRLAIQNEVDEAIAWADASPYPDPSTLLTNVYEEPPR
ncbi:MAG: thiamine pyrophosphate-dependent dehydrogenase E1 component subunit alpha [Bryobacterales bacterium]|nr:thiamine pyrophosphate-dependent dehydrogenase E1 component subunit alpha [Bryobacterales bacterium]